MPLFDTILWWSQVTGLKFARDPPPMITLALFNSAKIELFQLGTQWRASAEFPHGAYAATADTPGTALAGLGTVLEAVNLNTNPTK